MAFQNLKTNSMINFVKLFAVIALVLLLINFYRELDFYDLELPIFTVLMILIGWFNRIKFYKEFKIDEHTIQVIVNSNVFGVSYISITDDKLGLLKKARVRGKSFTLADDKTGLSVCIKLSEDGKLVGEVKKLEQ